MDDQIMINLSPDPQTKREIERMMALVKEANISHVVRAALRYFAENGAVYEQEVYIREQIDFEKNAVTK
jgi:hypothetical protein